MYQATVKYQYGPYSGEESFLTDTDETDYIIARLWGILRRRGLLTLPMAYQSATVTDVEQL